jgi:hypothetical protein
MTEKMNIAIGAMLLMGTLHLIVRALGPDEGFTFRALLEFITGTLFVISLIVMGAYWLMVHLFCHY